MPEDRADSSEDDPAPPPALPDALVDELRALDTTELQAVIEYARSLLPTRPAPADLIEERPDERILEVAEQDGFTTVIKEQPCVEGCEDCPHGPYLYRVRAELGPEADEPTLHWDFLGRVTSSDESEISD